MSLTVRNIRKEEVDQVAEVFKAVVEKLSYYNEDAIKQELAKYTSSELLLKIQEDPDSVIIAEESGNILGFCFSRIDDMLIWIEWFGIVEKYRKKGIAKELVRCIEASTHKRNAHKIWCDCRTENIKSIKLLSSLGYEPICTIKNHWYGQDFILWQKEIINEAR